jgi:hypothetical protein
MEVRKYLIITFFLLSCQKDLKTEHIITDLKASPASVEADGASKITVTVVLTDRAAEGKRNIVFNTTGGSWVDGKDGKVTVAGKYLDGKIIAEAKLVAPNSEQEIEITASSESLTLNGDFNLKTTVKATHVPPFKIKVEPTALGIGSNYSTEDTVSAKISGINNGNASRGVKVLFEDLIGSNPAGGRFRAVQTVSGASSIVSAIYGAPNAPIGTAITIRATVLDKNDSKTTISDSIVLTINK